MNTIDKVQKQISNMIEDYTYLQTNENDENKYQRYDCLIDALQNHAWTIEQCIEQLSKSDILIGDVDERFETYQKALIEIVGIYRSFIIHMDDEGEVRYR